MLNRKLITVLEQFESKLLPFFTFITKECADMACPDEYIWSKTSAHLSSSETREGGGKAQCILALFLLSLSASLKVNKGRKDRSLISTHFPERKNRILVTTFHTTSFIPPLISDGDSISKETLAPGIGKYGVE